MAVSTRDRPPIGPTPGMPRVNRGEQRGAQQEAARGLGLRFATTVTIDGNDSATVRHGLRAVPELVTVTPFDEPCSYAVTASTSEIVTVANNEPDPRKVQIGVFG